MIKVTKRDGRIVDFDSSRIVSAISSAFKDVDGTANTEDCKIYSKQIASIVEADILSNKMDANVEDIQDRVEECLMQSKRSDVAKSYILYRNERTLARGNSTDSDIDAIVSGNSEYWTTENSNKNPKIVTTQRDYIAGSTSTDIARRKLLPKDVVEAHDNGIIHFHDMDYFAQQSLTNCCLINLNDMLQNGTVINNIMIEKPHKFSTACTIATQIILGVSSSQYGGCTVTLTHLAPFVRDTFIREFDKGIKLFNILGVENGLKDVVEQEGWHGYGSLKIEYPEVYEFAMDQTKEDIQAGVQTFNYQVNSMANVNGQAPFLTVFMYLNETEEYREELAWVIEEFINQRILGFKDETGHYITPAFPKLIYVTQESNIKPGTQYWHLTELAAKCTAKRMVPDYISEKKMIELKGACYPNMGCRSFLTPDRFNENLSNAKDYEEGKGKYYGRFNMGVVTINLPYLGLAANKDEDKFWELFDKYTELCHKALRARYERVNLITSDAAPILWQYGAFARLAKGEKVTKLLHSGYATLSLGYAGLYECVYAMKGCSHTDDNGKNFALCIMRALNDKCNSWKLDEDIDYSLYGTPLESTTYKFAKKLREAFGEIKSITDRNYVTNSYHVPVFQNIDAFTKLKFESEFQELSPGGAISYIEVPDMTKNIEAIIQMIQYMYYNIMYAEINTKSDYCMNCGFEGEIELRGERGSQYWICPNCGNTDQKLMHVARRTCGYIGTQFWNPGRTDEIGDRVLHVD